MKIYVPSLNRYGVSSTLRELMEYGCQPTIVVREEEYADYRGYYPNHDIITTPNHYRIAQTRQFIVDHCPERDVLMLDDDLRFFRRTKPGDLTTPELRKITAVDFQDLILWIQNQLQEGYAHVGVADRTQVFQKYWKTPDNMLVCDRPTRIYAYNIDVLKEHKLSFGHDENTMDDFEMTLNLIEFGYPNVVTIEFATNQDGSNSSGGASTYRDLEVLRRSALALKERHPEFVKVKEVETISSWGGRRDRPVTRTDVTIQWKKALGSKLR